MERALLDTNIVIYLLNSDPRIFRFLETLQEKRLAVSIITWIEVLAGSFKHQKTIDEVEEALEYFEVLPIQKNIGRYAANLFERQIKQSGRIRDFQDGVIAATALFENIPLVTNNPKDFRRFKGLKMIVLK